MNDVTHRRVFVWADKSTWTSVKDDFALNYSHVRGYHGCRPFDVDSYYIHKEAVNEQLET